MKSESGSESKLIDLKQSKRDHPTCVFLSLRDTLFGPTAYKSAVVRE